MAALSRHQRFANILINRECGEKLPNSTYLQPMGLPTREASSRMGIHPLILVKPTLYLLSIEYYHNSCHTLRRPLSYELPLRSLREGAPVPRQRE